MSIVLYNKEWGVFVGLALGLAFWSNLDAGGQTSVPVFDDVDEAKKFLEESKVGGTTPGEIEFVEVKNQQKHFATMGECVKAGLPGWLSEDTPCSNTIPC